MFHSQDTSAAALSAPHS